MNKGLITKFPKILCHQNLELYSTILLSIDSASGASLAPRVEGLVPSKVERGMAPSMRERKVECLMSAVRKMG